MLIHLNPEVFRDAIAIAAEQADCPADIIEKDYYVWLMLRDLASAQKERPAVFKGGTAMYDKLGLFNRFSEDIDLTVPVEDLPSKNQARKRLEQVALMHDIEGLTLDKTDADYLNRKGSVTSVFIYEPAFAARGHDPLRRAGRVKIEATSFTQSQPTEPVSVVPLLASTVPADAPFDLAPATLPSLTLERIFVDKFFAAENYWLKGGEYLFDAAKHIYDLCVLLDQPRIATFLKDADQLSSIAEYTRREECDRLGSSTADMTLADASFLTHAWNDTGFTGAFQRMQDVYVFRPEQRITADAAAQRMDALRGLLTGH